MSYKLGNSFQAGLEFDSNVFKSYNVSRSDVLVRSLLKIDSDIKWRASQLSMGYKIGGKKYFTKPEQDTFISFFAVNYRQDITKGLALTSQSSLKFQGENDALDAEGLDINEDFLEFRQNLGLRYSPVRGLTIKPELDFYIFDFNGSYRGMSYYLAQYGFGINKTVTKPSQVGFIFNHKIYNFKNINRRDNISEPTVLLSYSKRLYASIAYSFQTGTSSVEELSFSNHKVSLIASVPVRLRRKDPALSDMNPDFVLSFIGILQFKNYSDRVFVDEEGIRYILSESEEDNFNILIMKVTKNITENWALEFKYTRHSNEFANTGEKYTRSTAYLGARYNY